MFQAVDAPSSARARQRWALILGSLTSFLVGLDALVVTTALPTLQQEFGTSIETLSWTIDGFALAFAATIIAGATLGDRLGRRAFFAVGTIIFTVASALCAVSGGAESLVLFRVLQGIGGGIAYPLSLALIVDATPPKERGTALGIWGAVTGVAVAAGPLIGGLIVEGMSWQWVFWVNVPVGIAIVYLTMRKLGETRGVVRRVDWLGLVLATAGLFGIAEGLIRGNEVGWTDPTIVLGLVGGVVVLALFIAWQYRAPSPMMPMQLFRNRSFTGGCAAGFCLTAGIYGLGFLTAQYLQLAMQFGPLEVGIRLLPATGMALIVSPFVGVLADRIGEKPLVIAGLGLFGTGLILLGTSVTGVDSYGVLVLPLLIAGVGIATAFPTSETAVMRSVLPSQAAIASGVSNTFRQVGAVFGVAVAVAVFTSNGEYGFPAEFAAGYRPAMMVLGLLSLLGVVAGFFIRREPIPDDADEPSVREEPSRVV
ncbi:DHA2 family efflux MFS transporter permease subunit [Blastococcus montanus]|uniref:DHA2 family efflux MFS transporter permease subunit n=1 Tax=Blastococcus montanus TaxID=3144973 RepID=UPI00320AB15E